MALPGASEAKAEEKPPAEMGGYNDPLVGIPAQQPIDPNAMQIDQVAPSEMGSYNVSPAEDAKAEEKPAEEPKAEEKQADQAEVVEKSAEEAKAEEKPAEEPKAEEKPIEQAEKAKAEEKPAEEPKAEEKQADQAEVVEKSAEEAKAEEKPAEEPKAEEKQADQAEVVEKSAEEAKAEEKPAMQGSDPPPEVAIESIASLEARGQLPAAATPEGIVRPRIAHFEALAHPVEPPCNDTCIDSDSGDALSSAVLEHWAKSGEEVKEWSTNEGSGSGEVNVIGPFFM